MFLPNFRSAIFLNAFIYYMTKGRENVYYLILTLIALFTILYLVYCEKYVTKLLKRKHLYKIKKKDNEKSYIIKKTINMQSGRVTYYLNMYLEGISGKIRIVDNDAIVLTECDYNCKNSYHFHTSHYNYSEYVIDTPRDVYIVVDYVNKEGGYFKLLFMCDSNMIRNEIGDRITDYIIWECIKMCVHFMVGICIILILF